MFKRMLTKFRTTQISFRIPSTNHVMDNIHVILSRVESSAALHVLSNLDITAGAILISSPEPPTVINFIPPKSSSQRVQQIVKKIIRSIPDAGLIALIVLMATDLVHREINSKKSPLPPVLRELANTTIAELDIKLETLSSFNWEVDPFLKAELETLQALPFERVDKFIVNEILPRINKEVTPYLSKLKASPEQVSATTQNIKDLIEITTMVLQNRQATVTAKQTNNLISQTTTSLLEQVDWVGASMEKGVRYWNRIINNIGDILNAKRTIDMIPELLLPLFNTSAYTAAASAASSTNWSLLATRQLNVYNSNVTSSTTNLNHVFNSFKTSPQNISTSTSMSTSRESIDNIINNTSRNVTGRA